MNHFESLASRIILGPIVPVSLGLASWWTAVLLQWSERSIALTTLTAFATGIAGAATLLRRWMTTLWTCGDLALRSVAVFYSVLVYGFFMGLPVFNVLVGAIGGVVVGRSAVLQRKSRSNVQAAARRWARFATLLLLLFCTVSAVLALREAAIGSELQHMLRLPFTVTREMVIGLIIVGGAVLLVVQYLAAHFAVLLGARLRNHRAT